MRRTTVSIKAKALALIAQREHSRVELRRKLLAYLERQARNAAALPAADSVDLPAADSVDLPAVDERQLDELLDWLAAKDLLSTERFIEMRIGSRAARIGNRRIQEELARHGLRLDADAAASLKASELRRAQAVWAKRFAVPAADAAGRAQQMRFLSARGFSADVVRKVVRGTAADELNPGE